MQSIVSSSKFGTRSQQHIRVSFKAYQNLTQRGC